MRITKTACIGAGLIGTGWATLFSVKGLDVAAYDFDNKRMSKFTEDIETNLQSLKENNMIDENEVRKALSRITVSDSIAEAVANADYVQESVFESYDLKKKVFAEIENNCPEEAVIASSTSAFSMTEIQTVIKNPGRCVIVHPASPVHIIPLVEIVPGSKTSDSTISLVYEFMSSLGKTPVVCKKEVPGFIINRLQCAIFREALDLVDKGVATVEEVDKAVAFGPGLRMAFMGPFLVMHLAGGERGIENWFERLAVSYFPTTARSMATWSSVPESAKKKAIEGMNKYNILPGTRYDQLAKWRDKKLIDLMRTNKSL